MAELNQELIREHFTPNVVRKMIEQLPEPSSLFETSINQTEFMGNDKESFHALYIKADGEVLDALIKMTNEEKRRIIEVVDQAMCNLGVNVPYDNSIANAGVLLTQAEHDAIVQKIKSGRYHVSFGPLDFLFRVRLEMACTGEGKSEWVEFSFYYGPDDLYVATDEESRFLIRVWLSHEIGAQNEPVISTMS